MDVIRRKHSLDDGDAHLVAGLADNFPKPFAQRPFEDLVAILGDPDEMIAVIENGVTTS